MVKYVLAVVESRVALLKSMCSVDVSVDFSELGQQPREQNWDRALLVAVYTLRNEQPFRSQSSRYRKMIIPICWKWAAMAKTTLIKTLGAAERPKDSMQYW